MLWEYLYTAGPKQLPFYTTLCLGSGKQRYQDGCLPQQNIATWFNLTKQSWQPSVPARQIQRHFDESFSGGSCVKVLPTLDPKRFFVTDFSCATNIIVAYTFKAIVSDEDLSIWLQIVNDNTGRYCQVQCCGIDYSTPEGWTGPEVVRAPLIEDSLRTVLIYLSEKQEKILPSHAPVNGWETRLIIVVFISIFV